MTSSKSRRQASIGDDSLFHPPNHDERSSSRYFSSGLAEMEGDVQSSGNAKAIGLAGFHSTAMARHLTGISRRILLKEKVRNIGTGMQESAMDSEQTPLRAASTRDDNFPSTGKYHTMEALKSIVLGKAVSIFLFFIPLAICANYYGWDAVYVFWLNFFVMIPLASILGDFTEEVALHTNDTIGGLVNATFGNAVEVLVAIQAMLADEIRVVQASMLGSIFSNLLLVLGCCFFFGGIKYKEQSFNSTSATASMGLLALSSIAMVLPTPFAQYYDYQDEEVLIISRIAAVFLLFMYIQLLIFQLHTHKDIFDHKVVAPPQTTNTMEAVEETDEGDETEEGEEASISMKVALMGLLLTTLILTFFSDYLVGSISMFCQTSGISRTFVGIVLLPIVGNATEHITAVTVAMKNKMDLSMGGTIHKEFDPWRDFSFFASPQPCCSRRWFLHPDFSVCCPIDGLGGMGRRQTNVTEFSSL
jgi:Ca2+:H+ antiporter